MQKIIEITDLNKTYGTLKALSDLSFGVNSGEKFAFLGENGAGKSTAINIICSVLPFDSGAVKVDGNDVKKDNMKIKNILGVVFQDSCLDADLSVYDNLKNRAALYGIAGEEFKRRIDELSEMLEFKPFLKRTLKKLSGGQKRKIDLARALIHKPRLLIMDEPTTGLDPNTRRLLWSVTDKMRKETGLTVFYSTHYMEEAADADRVLILDTGKVAAVGTPIELKNRYSGDFITIYSKDEQDIKKLGVPYERQNGSFRIEVESTSDATELILKHPELFTDYEIEKGRMDDVFLAVAGKKPSEGDEYATA